MNKRLLGLTSSAFILAAAFTGCTDGKGKKPDIKDYKGSYTCNGYASWSGDKYPDCETIQNDLKNDPMTISADGTMHFHGSDYKLVPERITDEAVIFSIDGSGFDLSKYPYNGVTDNDYDGAVYFAKETQHYTVNDEDQTYDTYNVYLTVKDDDSCAAYISFEKD